MSFFNTYFPKVNNPAGNESSLLRVFHAVYFVLLTILIGSQVVSKFMMSGMQILLLVNWLLELIVIHKLKVKGQPSSFNPHPSTFYLLSAFLVLMAVHLLWLIGSDNIAYGLDDIFRKLPLLAIPLVVLTSKPLNRKQTHFLLFFYVATLFVATIIGVVRLLTIPDLPYRETVPFISHIRFSLNICVAIVLLIWHLVTNIKTDKLSAQNSKSKFHYLSVVLILWFICFLFILRSYTAFFVLFVSAWIMLFIYWRRLGKRRLWALSALILLTLTIAFSSLAFVKSYYGNFFNRQRDGLVENGYLLNDCISRSELEKQWPSRSSMVIDDTTPNGYTIYPTLVRYLNASGLTKDSAGLASLDNHDIELIEKGIANPVYVDGLSLRKMVYVLLFEYENYRVNGNIRNSSLLERLELWRGAWRVFCDNPLFGVGTGDAVDQLHARLQADNSQIADTHKHAHNQFLSFLVAFGLVGFLLITMAFVLAFRKSKMHNLPAYMAIVIILLLSFISEDTLETLAGCVLCTLIPCLLARSQCYENKI